MDNLLSMLMMGGLPATQQMGGVNSGLMQQMRALRYLRGSPGRSMRPQGGGQGGSPMQGMGEPDYSQFSFDPEARAAANKQLGQYGLHTLAPEDVNPNALLPNSGFFGRHPGIARGIEGGIFGAAATRPSDTWGEGISNVAQGLIGGRQMRQSMVNRQFAAPFEQARMLEGLEDMSQKRDLNKSMIDWHNAQTANAGRKMDEHVTPLGREVPGYLDSTGKYTDNPGYDPKEARRQGQTVEERIWEGMKGEPPTPGTKAHQKYYQDMGNWMQGRKAQVAGASAGARTTATIKAEGNAGIDKSDKYKDAEWQHKQNLQNLDKKEYRDEVASRLMQQNGFKSMPTEQDIDSEIGKKKDSMNKDFESTWGGTSSSPKVRKFNPTTGKLE